MKKLITLLLFMGCVLSASAAAGWVGAGAINVNETWYYADGHESTSWCSGPFTDLGTLTYLSIGGQVQLWDENSSEWGSGSTATMYYKIDDAAYTAITLKKYKFENNNNFFQSGGNDFTATPIDIRSLSLGNHTLTVKFVDVDNLKPTIEYSASFTKAPYNISDATVTGIADTDWTGSLIHPVPVVTAEGITLTNGVDYSVSYSAGCVEVGNYTVTISGDGTFFTGSKVIDFAIKLPDAYYLVRSTNEWALDPSNILTNINYDEWRIRNIVLANDEGIKVIYASNNGESKTWYPGGTGNEYKPGRNTYDVYFRPNYYSGEGWHHGHIYVSALTSLDVTLAPAGYGTYYNSACDVTLPDGVSAYILKSVKDGDATYEKIADGSSVNNIVYAGNAMLLYSATVKEAGEATDITLGLSSPSSSGSVRDDNLLHGSDIKTTTYTDGASKYYKLTYGKSGGEHENDFGWFYGAEGGGAFTLPAHKVWLALSGESGSRAFLGLPSDDVTGIVTIENKQQKADNVWYDLNGRRISAPMTKGIYVKDGCKVVIK